MSPKTFMILDLLVLIGAPTAFVPLMVWATCTPGNPAVGLFIGWAANLGWLAIGAWAAIQRYVLKQ